MKKILFIDPNGWQGAVNGNPAIPNNGIAYLCAVLRIWNWNISILDMNNVSYSIEDVLKHISDFLPDIIGFSCKTATYKAAVYVLHQIRLSNYTGKVIMGGPHITLNADRLCKESEADLLFEGDGEIDLPPVLDYLLESDKDVPVLAYGEIIHCNEKTKIYKRLSLQPIPENIFPDYSLFPENTKEYLKENYPLFSSRGCPYHCIYCSVPLVTGKKWRARSVDSIIAELKYAMKQWNITKFDIIDDSWNVDMNRCKEMCRRIIDERILLSCAFPNGIRADRKDEELASLMKKSGCIFVAVGFENTDPDVFSNIQKGSTVEIIVNGIRILQKQKIPVSAYFIVGLPYDTFEKEMRNIRFIRSLHIKPFFNLLVPYPHTKVFEYVSSEGKWLADPESSMHFCNNLENLPITFEYPYFSADEIRKAYITAHIKSKSYEYLSAYPKFSFLFYWQSAKVILKYAPECLPEYILTKFKNIFIQLYQLFRRRYK